MNIRSVIMAVAVWGVVGMPCFGIPATAARLDDLGQAAASNDIEQARVIYRGLDLRSGDALETIRTAARAVPASPDALELRREMATKYRLLADDAAPLPAELADVVPYDVPVVSVTGLDVPYLGFAAMDVPALAVEIMSSPILPVRYLPVRYLAVVAMRVATLTVETLDVRAVAIPGLRYTYLDIIALDPDVLAVLGVDVPVVAGEGIEVPVVYTLTDKTVAALIALWESRYARQIDFRDGRGNLIVPMRGTVLWAKRKAVIEAVEAGGDYDALWDAYNAHLRRALGRRNSLKGRRGR